MIPKITLPTRITEHSATLIDNMYTNMNSDKINAGTLITDISDHFSNFMFVNTNKKPNKPIPKYITYRPLTDYSVTVFNQVLNNADWSGVLSSDNPCEAYSLFINKYLTLLNQTIPEKTVRFNKNKHKIQPWITRGILKSHKTKNKLFNKLQGYHNQLFYKIKLDEYTAYRNIYNNVIRMAKKNYWHDQFEQSIGNMKETWKNINLVTNRSNKKANFPDIFVHKNKELKCKLDIANELNDYFTNIGPTLANAITSTQDINIEVNIPNSFMLTPASSLEIIQIIDKFKPKTSRGYDGISSKLLKNTILSVITPITHIMNLSLEHGVFPTDMKLAKVIPIFKKGNNQLFQNYRPISLLPVFSKVLEKLVYKRLYQFLKTHKLLNTSQYGFQKHKSTDLAILDLQNRIIDNASKNQWSLGIFLDLSKAFDTLDHSILLKKLEKYGIRGTSLKWFRSYLSQRNQYTEYMTEHSRKSILTCGVPQGSILGPLLFLIYINDLVSTCTHCHPVLFADDTNLLLNDSKIEHLIAKSNNQLQAISQWFASNKLSLNIDKTKCMLFPPSKNHTPDQPCIITINNNQIEVVNQIRFLGVLIDNLLTWTPHIDNIIKKLSQIIGILTRIKNQVPKNTLKLIYNALVLPYLSYAVVAWGNPDSKKFKQLYLIQKRAIRVINKEKYNAHTGPLFSANKILILEDLYKLQCAKLVHKRINNILPDYFNQLLPTFSEIHQYNTRHANAIVPCLIKHSLRNQQLSIKLSIVLSNLPPSIINISNSSINSFSNSFKNCCISNYPTECEIINCYICNL